MRLKAQDIVDGGYRVDEIKVAVLTWIKGSSPSQVYIVSGKGGGSTGMAPTRLGDLGQLVVGNVYRFYLSKDTVWFQGNNHYMLAVAETLA